MSLNLAQLHRNALAVRSGDWSAGSRAVAEGAYRARAVEIAEGLPFLYSLMRVERTRMATNHGELVHIVPAEPVNLGKLRRLAGQALCRGHYGYAGRFDLAPVEEGANCYACLAIAEGHSRNVDREQRAS